jgi:phosphohistidine phosphatase
MKLWILRHARAELDSPTGRDRDRPLSAQGRSDCLALNAWLKDCPYDLPPEARVSPALRTRQTAQLALSDLTTKQVGEPTLWMASTSDLVALIDAFRSQSSLWLIGHNPGLEDLIYRLGSDLPVPGLKPGTLVILDLPDKGAATRLDVVRP